MHDFNFQNIMLWCRIGCSQSTMFAVSVFLTGFTLSQHRKTRDRRREQVSELDLDHVTIKSIKSAVDMNLACVSMLLF